MPNDEENKGDEEGNVIKGEKKNGDWKKKTKEKEKGKSFKSSHD